MDTLQEIKVEIVETGTYWSLERLLKQLSYEEEQLEMEEVRVDDLKKKAEEMQKKLLSCKLANEAEIRRLNLQIADLKDRFDYEIEASQRKLNDCRDCQQDFVHQFKNQTKMQMDAYEQHADGLQQEIDLEIQRNHTAEKLQCSAIEVIFIENLGLTIFDQQQFFARTDSSAGNCQRQNNFHWT